MNKAYQLFNAYRSYDPEGAQKARECVPRRFRCRCVVRLTLSRHLSPSRDRKGRTFGAFKPTYLSRTVLRPPRSDAEAQE